MRAEFIGIGALLSGVLALSCCGSALLFLLFGVSMASFGFLDRLAPYQLWFQITSLLLLTLAWIRLYRRRTCLRNSKRTLWILLTLTVLLLVLLAVPYMDFS